MHLPCPHLELQTCIFNGLKYSSVCLPSQTLCLQMKCTCCPFTPQSIHLPTQTTLRQQHTPTTHTPVPLLWLPVSMNDNASRPVAHPDNLGGILDSSLLPSHPINKYILTLSPLTTFPGAASPAIVHLRSSPGVWRWHSR